MKKLAVIFLSIVFVFTLVACNTASGGTNSGGGQLQNSNSNSSGVISGTPSQTTPLNDSTPKFTREQALSIALEKVNATADKIADLEVELEYENGTLVYEIDFDFGDKEYSFDIGANDGAVISQKSERHD